MHIYFHKIHCKFTKKLSKDEWEQHVKKDYCEEYVIMGRIIIKNAELKI